MTESSGIQQLRYLYKRLAETLIPEDEATPEEAEALDSEPKKYLSEAELVETLRKKAGKNFTRSASD
jgi:hypothetical protein